MLLQYNGDSLSNSVCLGNEVIPQKSRYPKLGDVICPILKFKQLMHCLFCS